MKKTNNYFHIAVILLMIVFLGGCTGFQAPTENNQDSIDNGQTNKLNLENVDLSLLAYQLEAEVRSSFHAAYKSWVNLSRVTKENEDNFEQILSMLRANLSDVAYEEEIEEHINKLKQINKGGEGEMAFSTHEVVKNSEVKEQDDNTVQVQINATRYYPATEWGGESYNKDLNYVVNLVKNNGNWMIQEVSYK